MSQIKNPQQFAAIEYCLQHYFTEELAPVMKQVKDELNRKQVKELADYQRSPAGILAAALCRAENIDPSHERDISAFLKVLADEYRREDLEKGSRIQ